MTLASPPFGEIFGCHVWIVPGNTCVKFEVRSSDRFGAIQSLGTCLSNLKSVALTVFELFAFNAQKFRGSRDPGHAPFWENFWGSCPDCPWEYECQI